MKIIRSCKSWDYEGLDTPSDAQVIASGDDLTDLFKEMENDARQKAWNSGTYSRIDFEKINEKRYSLYYFNAISREYYTLID